MLIPAAPSGNPEPLCGSAARGASWAMAPPHTGRFDVSDAAAILRSPSSTRSTAADIGGNESPASALMTGLRAQCTGGIYAPAPDVTELVANEVSRDLARPVACGPGSRCESHDPVR